MPVVSAEERFLFDVQGFLLLRNVLSEAECQRYRQALDRLENSEYDDSGWINAAPAPYSHTMGRALPPDPTRAVGKGSVRMNGLLRLDPVFHELIVHPAINYRLREFLGEPLLGNTWSISKTEGADHFGWHRGEESIEYNCRNGVIRTGMLNVIYFLTDNGPQDGCIAAVPGSHKNNIDLPWNDYPGLNLPGSVAITGKAGDVFMFSESVLHTGLPKTSKGTRTNLYFNHVRSHHYLSNLGAFLRHGCVPPKIRDQFTPEQKKVTIWMEDYRPEVLQTLHGL